MDSIRCLDWQQRKKKANDITTFFYGEWCFIFIVDIDCTYCPVIISNIDALYEQSSRPKAIFAKKCGLRGTLVLDNCIVRVSREAESNENEVLKITPLKKVSLHPLFWEPGYGL